MLQTIVEDDKRGRVMSLYTMAFMGMAPFGSILGGALADHTGVAMTFFVGGGACLLGAADFWPANSRTATDGFANLPSQSELSSRLRSAYRTLPGYSEPMVVRLTISLTCPPYSIAVWGSVFQRAQASSRADLSPVWAHILICRLYPNAVKPEIAPL